VKRIDGSMLISTADLKQSHCVRDWHLRSLLCVLARIPALDQRGLHVCLTWLRIARQQMFDGVKIKEQVPMRQVQNLADKCALFVLLTIVPRFNLNTQRTFFDKAQPRASLLFFRIVVHTIVLKSAAKKKNKANAVNAIQTLISWRSRSVSFCHLMRSLLCIASPISGAQIARRFV
jgi:hypothetical protein